MTTQHQKRSEHLTEYVTRYAPGSFELPRVIQHLAKKRQKETTIYVAVGILVKGDTDHYDLVAKETTAGIARLQLEHDLWIVNCVLGVHNVQQAADRCLPGGSHCVGFNMAHAVARLALNGFVEE